MYITGENLSIYDVYEVAVNRERVEFRDSDLVKVKEASERVEDWGAARFPIYGVNTGFGELIHYVIPPKHKTALQLNLLRSHAAGWGDRFPEDLARAMMIARLNCFMKGHSGVSVRTVQLMAEFLNRDISPVIPMHGSLGASGDLAPLSHMALPLIGDGEVIIDGQQRPAAEVLAEHHLQPLELGYKEALALINGTSAMTGVACIAHVRAATLLKLAVFASAAVVQCLRGSTRAFESRGHELKNHKGQVEIAAALRSLLEDNSLTREHPEIMREISQRVRERDDVVDAGVFLQHAYTLRCIPQILGPVLDTLAFSRRIVEEELNSCNDNPLIMETPEETFHGGNFHGQYVAMACDYLSIALTEIGVLAERQLNRLIDPHLNGELPACLAEGETGLHCGFEGAQYLATSLAAENLDLAAPSSVKSIPSNGSNQDVVSMGLISARRAVRLCEHVLTILASLVAASLQASQFVGREKLSPPIREFHQALSNGAGLYRDSEAIAGIIANVRTLLGSQEATRCLEENVKLANLKCRPWTALRACIGDHAVGSSGTLKAPVS